MTESHTPTHTHTYIYIQCGTIMEYLVPNTCTCVERWRDNDWFSSMVQQLVTKIKNFFIIHCSSSCAANQKYSALNTCTCVSGWTGNDCLTWIIIFNLTILFTRCFIRTQQFVILNVTLIWNVQLQTLVLVGLDRLVVIV